MARMRKSGVLLHPTSLPGDGGIGSFGEQARRFVDFLHKAGQSLWQILPLGPTAYGNSPYSCYSAFAGNPLLISLETLVEEGDLAPEELRTDLTSERIDYVAVEEYKRGTLRRAATQFFATGSGRRKEDFWHFCDSTFWLHDFALFMALKTHFEGMSWNQWPDPILKREPEALSDWSDQLGSLIGEQKYQQWQFFLQWRKLKKYANAQGISIVGDLPIFVAFDSADVWANPHLFHLDEQGVPSVVAGVPPDYFSKTGQLWGNPLYNWDRMAADGFGWWVARLKNDLSLYDMVRIDHFRGFEAYWEVPHGAPTAEHGHWVKGPGDALFHAMRNAIGELPIIAEDLGVITSEVEALRDRFGFPGMKILQFAFGSGSDNPYLPHNHVRESVVYTGTHDNDTTAGWFSGLKAKEQKAVLTYLDRPANDIVWHMINAALASVANYAVIPMQDLLELPSSSRMNVPGVASGNWGWRCPGDVFSAKLATRLAAATELYGRFPERL
ncbi:4-alpha-glucanotransferase [Geomesophilobacter sediminis]|uniref:4-alpha-glucanotransferase n=1 Tax=Geomesophilobacter sediminis TaxID=2798584 RepID=A0A8J7M2X2_9BACT|nr:4-alpha-glucanotransferase [Geomesophilobacter sediminis]MBJ6727647.1 4-alpha-glucanotransferase [Geomesophilobacter sediminis]